MIEGFSANYSGAGFSDMRFTLHGVDDGQVRPVGRDGEGQRPGARPADLPAAGEAEREGARRCASPRVDPDLYRRILERCVEPGKPCMTDHGARPDAGGGHPDDMRPMRHAGAMPMPRHGKPEGAIVQAPRRVGARDQAAIRRRDGSTRQPENRNMTSQSPSAPCTRRHKMARSHSVSTSRSPRSSSAA